MSDIKEIFKGGLAENKSSQLMTIPIDWTSHSKGILNIAKYYEPKFVITENNANVLRLMLLYFTGNPLFETETGGTLNKGLMLIGGIGTGKSLLFKIFQQYTKEVLQTNSFQSYSAMEIIDETNVNGIKTLEIFGHNMIDKVPKPIRLYIDDIASKEENVSHFGTKLNVIEQLLSTRYNIYERYGTLTHSSSNLYSEAMKRAYDERVYDRMKTMFNFIELSGNSFRK